MFWFLQFFPRNCYFLASEALKHVLGSAILQSSQSNSYVGMTENVWL